MQPEAARRATAQIIFDGTDITSSITPYLLSLSYTDNEEDETDDLQIKLQDRDSIWLQSWLMDAVDAAAAGTLKIDAAIIRKNWTGSGDMVLPCGVFELDSVSADGPPSTVTIKASSLAFSSDTRQTKKSKAWEGYYLSGIANEMAGEAGMTCMFESDFDPYYSRVEQFQTSNIMFLSELCHKAGLSLKITNSMIVIFKQETYEAKSEVFTIVKDSGSYVKHKLTMGSADTQYGSCRVSYTDPATGNCIVGTAKADEKDSKSDQVLEISSKVASVAEANTLAAKMLRLHNKYERTAQFTLPGNPMLVAGLTVKLQDWGGWDGKYIIKSAKHSVSNGYTTQITLRRILEGY